MDGTHRVRSFLTALLLLTAPRLHAASSETLLLTAQTPAGGVLLAVDPLSGARRPLALWSDADVAGVSVGAAGRIHVLDRGLGGAPARVLLVDVAAGVRRTLTSGGFLSDPRHAAELPDGDLLVVDRSAAGGRGALVRVHPDGAQDLVSFGRLFSRPSDLVVDAQGRVLVLDERTVLVDPVTGEQRRSASSCGPFERPLACDLRPGIGAFVCDGGALLFVDLERDRVTRLTGMPSAFRDVAMTADGALFGAWSAGGEGGVLLVRRNGPSARVSRGPDLADVRGLALAPELAHSVDLESLDLAVPFEAPPVPRLPPVTIELRASTATLLNGPGPADDEVLPAGPFPLATALRAARPGSTPVIGVIGEVPGELVTIGGGDAGDKSYVAHWGSVPMRFAVVGLTPDARIHAFTLAQSMSDGRVNGGVVDAWFQDLTIEARYAECVNAPKGHSFGIARFYGCRFVPDRRSLAAGDFGGYGYRWGIRSQARGRWDLRGCTFAPVEEHAVYVDSPQGDSYFVDLQHTGSTRTAIQVVNRSIDNPGPSGVGTLLFEDVRIQGLWGDGGSGITVAGHLGDLVFRRIRAREWPAPASHGVIVVWADADPVHGLFLRRGAGGGLHATGKVVIESTDVVLPHVDRPMIAIAGAEEVRIDGFVLEGDRLAFALDSPYGVATASGPAVVDGRPVVLQGERVANGRVSFGVPCPISLHPGFRTPFKVQVGDRLLSDAEIDALGCR